MSEQKTEPRVLTEFPSGRECEKCGSERLALVVRAEGYARKECLDCGSTGPFGLRRIT